MKDIHKGTRQVEQMEGFRAQWRSLHMLQARVISWRSGGIRVSYSGLHGVSALTSDWQISKRTCYWLCVLLPAVNLYDVPVWGPFTKGCFSSFFKMSECSLKGLSHCFNICWKYDYISSHNLHKPSQEWCMVSGLYRHHKKAGQQQLWSLSSSKCSETCSLSHQSKFSTLR